MDLSEIRPIAAKCPFCAKPLPSHTMATPYDEGEDVTPQDGDFTLCIGCGEWCVFVGAGEGIRKPVKEEYEIIVADPDFRMARAAWVAAMEEAKAEQQQRREDVALEVMASAFSANWEGYRKQVIPNLGPKAAQTCKDAFFGGAMTVLNLLREVVRHKDDVPDTHAGFNAIRNEIVDYLNDRRNKTKH